jgi:hypothetical protein
MTTTPPTDAELDAWFESWLTANWPSANVPLWGLDLVFVVVGWTSNDGSQTFQLMDPTGQAQSGPATQFNEVPESVWFNGLVDSYGLGVKVYVFPVPAQPTAAELTAPDVLQQQYSDQANWIQPR